MKKAFLAVLVTTLALLVLVGVSSAALPGGGWWHGATYQNVGASAATLNITAYDSASTNTYSYSPASLAPGASLNVLPNDIPGLPAGFIGSVVVSSDQSLAALVNVTNRLAAGFGVSGGKAAAIYSGVDGTEASTSVQFPLVKYNHFNKTTTFYLQNAGANPTTISVRFAVNGNYNYVTPSVGPGQMVAVDPGLAGVPAGNGQVGAMTATSAEPIAAVMLEHEHSASVAQVLQGSAGFAPSGLDDVSFCPIIKKNYFGRQTGLQVQNTSGSTQNIKVTYVGAGGTFVSTANAVPAGNSITFFNDPNITTNGLYSAKVEGLGGGNVAAIVNESELPLVNARQTSTTYACKAASSATTKISFPAYKELWFGRTIGLQIQNVGTSTASNVVLTFTDNNGQVRTTKPQSIASNASTTFVCISSNGALWNGTSLASSTLSGVIVTADQPIIAVANEASWASVSPCVPDNGANSFDKANAVGFNLIP